MTHTGVCKMLCTDSNLRPRGRMLLYLFVSTVCLSCVKARFPESPAGRICLARNALSDWVLNREVIS